MADTTQSTKVWKKFRRNTLALTGLIFICFMVVVGILGYLITPDQTPYANTMHLQLTNKKPGRTFQFLIVSRNENIKQVGLFEKMLFGQEANFKSIPINNVFKGVSEFKIALTELLISVWATENKKTGNSIFFNFCFLLTFEATF